MNSGVVVRGGSIADYDRLGRFHYRAGRPATVVRVLVAFEVGAAGRTEAQSPIGVLVVSMPARFGPWRARAWPDEELSGARVNATMRVISRVVVEPRWRGLGVARQLVRAYLDDPLTVRTEAIAAMGRVCPLFERAGMTHVDWSPARRVLRLRAALRAMGIEPWRLVDAAGLLAEVSGARRELLEAALRTFARAHGDTRDRAEGSVEELIELAARRVSCEPVVYVHSRVGHRSEERGQQRGAA